MSKRFILTNTVITDTWTEYTYDYKNINDYRDICGLLNQLQENMDLLSAEKISADKNSRRLEKILRTIQEQVEKGLPNE